MTKTIAPNSASIKAPSRKRVKPLRKTIPVVPMSSAAVEGEKLSGAEEVREGSNLQPLSRQSLTGLPIEEPPTPSGFDVEHDIWVKLPPKQEFTVKMRLVCEGKAKPNFFVDWIADDK